MTDMSLQATALAHQLHGTVCGVVGRRSAGQSAPAPHDAERDRGAVSLEQVLWFVAAGVSVAVIAAILWNRIRNEANTPIQSPSAP